MATRIITKNGSGAPLASDLQQGELAVDLTNKRLYTEDSLGAVQEIGVNPTSLTTGTFTSTGIDDNATSTAITIDSNENVGIGTSSPSQELDVTGTIRANTLSVDGGSNRYIFITSSDGLGECELRLGDVSDTDAGAIAYNNADNSMQFRANAAERMRIDSSGNLLVGKTTTSNATAGAELNASGQIVGTFANGTHIFGRNSSDGSILELQKDGTTVGSVGTAYNQMYLGSGATGLYFSDTSKIIHTINTTTLSGGSTDGTVDLGYSGTRFKDLYLSGGVYLGGTGSANHLDDYEEGTFGGTANGWTVSGQYTKIGQIVHVRGYVTLVSATLNRWTDMPFAASISQTSINGTNAGHITINNVSTYAAGSFAHVYNNTNDLYIYNSTGATYGNPANGSFAFNFTYTTT